LKESLNIYKKLHSTIKSLNEQLSIDEAFDIATNFAVESLEFDKCAIFKHDEQNGLFRIHKSKGYNNPVEQKVLKIITLLLSGEIIENLRIEQKPIIHTANNSNKIVQKLVKSLFLNESYFELFGGDINIPYGLIVIGNNKEKNYFSENSHKEVALNNFVVQFSNTINNIIFYKAWKNEKALLEENIKKRTEQIKAQQETFEAIYKTSKDGIAILDVETTAFLDVNEAYEEITGYSRKELLRLSCLKISLESDREKSSKAVKEVMATGYIRNFKKRCINKNQTISIVSMSISLMSDKKRMIASVKDITEFEEQRIEIEKAHKNIKDSIKFSSLIQTALLPDPAILDKYTKENFIFWQPKDTVGGDIYLITEIESTQEIFILIFDGAGHGVPGAFVTMLVKAIENQLSEKLKNNQIEKSPAKILEYFNFEFKTMLKQDKKFRSRKDNTSNAGFDGSVIHYKKNDNFFVFAGAKSEILILEDDEVSRVKGDRSNVGFFRTKFDYKFTDIKIDLKANTKIYITTDGYLDQNVSYEDKPFGLENFQKLILDIKNHNFKTQKELILENFHKIKGEKEQIDDITVVGIEFNKEQ
jgi:PAS domain S-box-containing protein